MPYWTAPATVDWCEPNYVYSVWIAEWWNTLSSLPIAALGLVALAWSLGEPWRRAPRFAAAAVVLFVVGLGSAAFHGTLLRVGQALDELPMVYAGLTYLYIVAVRRGGPFRARWRLGLIAFGLVFTVGYVVLDRWFVFFVAAYASLVGLLVVRTAQASFAPDAPAILRLLFVVSAGSYVGGVVLLWIPERLLLPCDHPIQHWQLHAWFHLTSAVGSYAWLAWAAVDRAYLAGRRGRIARWLWPVSDNSWS